MKLPFLPVSRLGLALLGALVLSLGVAQAAEKKSGWTRSAGQSTSSANPYFLFKLTQASTVQFDLESTTVDTFLYVLDFSNPFSPKIHTDDDSGDGVNSRLTLNLNAGNYYVIAATYSDGRDGNFTLRTSTGSLQFCFTAYTDSNYGGDSNMFCEGGSGSFQNDAYSSFRVPKGMRLRAFQHSNQTGLARTYYSDTPWVGDLYNDMISSISWSDFLMDDYFMVFASDPQFSWNHCSDPDSVDLCAQERSVFAGYSDEDLGRLYNARLTNAINTVKNYLGDYRFGGTVVNGDLTEFGDQGPDLGDYISYYEHGLNMNVYLGLGNHDYQNNVNDCYENGCASTMVWYLKDQAATLNPYSFDYYQSNTYYDFPNNRRDHSGSLGYSWEIGNIHFVQLNNFPSYSTSWNGWNYSSARRDYFTINSALTWLRNDVSNAVSRGKKIILNMHDYGADAGNSTFTSVLNDFPVTALFAGHWHERYGRYAETGPYSDGRKMPVFTSGSAHYGTFLVTRFVNGKMYVWVMSVDQFGGGSLRVKYNNTYYAASNLNGIFDVCTGCSRYYEYVYDLR